MNKWSKYKWACHAAFINESCIPIFTLFAFASLDNHKMAATFATSKVGSHLKFYIYAIDHFKKFNECCLDTCLAVNVQL